jgi:hypothetical protein
VTVAPDGQILIGGNFTGVNGTPLPSVARLNPDGSIDPSFIPPAGPDGPVNAILLYHGKIYLGGDFTSIGGVPRKNLARLNADGSLDLNFDPGIGPDAPVNSLVVQSTGQILVAGEFNSVNGFFSPGIARLKGEAGGQISISAIQAANGSVLITFNSEIGRTYVIEASSDLQTWQEAGTITASAASTDFTAPINSPHQFYRVRVNP